MTRYQLLDAIADAYTPLLGLAWLATCLLSARHHGARAGLARLALGLAGATVVYALAWLDARAGLWPRAGLDYSTHTAIALAFAAAILPRWPRARVPLVGSLLAYAALMLVQRYHTPADIVSTAAALLPPLAGLAAWLGRRTQPPGRQPVVAVEACAPPADALLRGYAGRAWVDCYRTRVAGDVAAPAYVRAFYTSAPFRLERALLALAGYPSRDAGVVALAAARTDRFAAWTVEARTADQLLLCDANGATRSWLMAAPAPDGGTALYFGSAIAALAGGVGGSAPHGQAPRPRAPYRQLLRFHRLYSRVLLACARDRLARAGARDGASRAPEGPRT